MRIRICSNGFQGVPDDLETLDSHFLAQIDTDGSLRKPGIVVNSHLPGLFFKDVGSELLDYRTGNSRLIFYADEGLWSRSTVLSGLQEFIQLEKTSSFKQEDKTPHIIGLLSNSNNRFTALLSVSGNPGKDVFQNAVKLVSQLNRSEYLAELQVLDKHEFCHFLSLFLHEGASLTETSTNPLEGKITAGQPEEVLGHVQIKYITDQESLTNKIDKEEWKFLTAIVKERFALTVSKSRPDIFSVVLFDHNLDNLVKTGEDIIQKYSLVKKGKLKRQKSLESWFKEKK
ncbi:MAG: hypothetical protein ACTSP4_07625 [Candidatus Hodarchaeales archaeon]